MKRIMRILAMVLMCALLSCACLAENAGPRPSLRVQNAEYGENNLLRAVVYSTVEGQDIQMSLNNTPFTPSSVTPYGESEEGTTWLFVVDTKSVSTKKGKEPVSVLINDLIDGLGPNDNAAITYNGVAAGEIELMGVKNLKNLAGSLELSDDDNLNSAIAAGIEFLNTNNAVKPHVSIVVISRGDTLGAQDMKYSEINSLIDESRVTVYAVAFSQEASNMNNVNSFVEMANVSCGGLQFQQPNKSKNAKAIAQAILDNEKNFVLIQANPSLQGAKGTLFKVWVDGGDAPLADSYELNQKNGGTLMLTPGGAAPTQLPGDDLPTNPPAEQPTAPAGTTEEPAGGMPSVAGKVDDIAGKNNAAETEPEPAKDTVLFGLTLVQLLLIGGGVLLLIAAGVVILIVVMKGKKGKKDGRDGHTRVIESEYTPKQGGGVMMSAGGPPSTPVDLSGDRHVSIPLAGAPMNPGLQLQLTDMATRRVYSAVLDRELVIGRNPGPNGLAIVGDAKMSGSHLVLRVSGGKVMAEDCSRNGTKINGTAITRPTPVRQQDTLTMGLSNFKISWR